MSALIFMGGLWAVLAGAALPYAPQATGALYAILQTLCCRF